MTRDEHWLVYNYAACTILVRDFFRHRPYKQFTFYVAPFAAWLGELNGNQQSMGTYMQVATSIQLRHCALGRLR